jgi:hypothetical protein
MWFCILVCGEKLMFCCNEAEDFSPLGLHTSILDGGHNFKKVVVKAKDDAFYFKFTCSNVFYMEKILSPSSN